MTPIARAMTAALGALIATTTACAAPGERPQRATAGPEVQRQRAIAATADGFVIRAAAADRADNMPVSASPRHHVPVGTGTHIDARLLTGQANTIREISHAHP